MNTRVKKKWLAALRSGKYQQTRLTLHRVQEGKGYPKGYCCLGVLCEIAPKYLRIKRVIEDGVEFFDTHDSFLPRKVFDWSGVAYDKMRDLEHLNDKIGMTFSDIADYIEKNL